MTYSEHVQFTDASLRAIFRPVCLQVHGHSFHQLKQKEHLRMFICLSCKKYFTNLDGYLSQSSFSEPSAFLLVPIVWHRLKKSAHVHL